jgi:hypothetical protein
MKHFKITFQFTRTVESDDPKAVGSWAYRVEQKIRDAIKPRDLSSGSDTPGVQVLGSADPWEKTVTVEDLGEVR